MPGGTVALPYKLIAFDVDGTLVDDTVFIWTSLHEGFSTDEVARKKAANRYFSGKISYADWFENDLHLLRKAGATKEGIMDIVKNMRVANGVEQTLNTLSAAGARLIIISGTIDVVTSHFKLNKWFDEIYLNKIHFGPKGTIIGGTPTPYDVYYKAAGLRESAKAAGIPIEETAFIGDNFNDVEVAKAAGFSIAYNCKSDELSEAANVTIEGGDMTRILPYLLP
jgi:HAD superfamily phosphoserine phosphatase-like hydrolase